jgi:hypothetical protein
MEQKGKVMFDIENKLIIRKPTASNLIEDAGSDNDIYVCNLSQNDVTDLLKKILEVKDIPKTNGKKYYMNFYGSEVEILFNINNQNRISFRILGKDRLYGMIKYCNDIFGIELEKDTLKICFDFKNMNISFMN